MGSKVLRPQIGHHDRKRLVTVKGGAGGKGREYFDLRSYSVTDGVIEETFVAQELTKGVNGPITLPPDTKLLAVTTRTPWTVTVR